MAHEPAATVTTLSAAALLPGVAPTGRRVEMALVVIVGVNEGKVTYENIDWDQAGLLVQLGLLDPAGLRWMPTRLAGCSPSPARAEPRRAIAQKRSVWW